MPWIIWNGTRRQWMASHSLSSSPGAEGRLPTPRTIYETNFFVHFSLSFLSLGAGGGSSHEGFFGRWPAVTSYTSRWWSRCSVGEGRMRQLLLGSRYWASSRYWAVLWWTTKIRLPRLVMVDSAEMIFQVLGSLVAEDDVPSPKYNRCGPVCSCEENMEDVCSHPVPFQVCAADNKMVLRAPWVSPPCKRTIWVYMMIVGMFSSTNIANLPSSSLEFCMGAEISTGSLPEASQSRPQGVWVNASSNPIQLASVLPKAGNMFKGDKGLGGAWQRPKVIPMASISELGMFSKDANTGILDEEEINATVKKI